MSNNIKYDSLFYHFDGLSIDILKNIFTYTKKQKQKKKRKKKKNKNKNVDAIKK